MQDGRPGGLAAARPPALQNAECEHIMFVGNLVAEASHVYKRRAANKPESSNLIYRDNLTNKTPGFKLKSARPKVGKRWRFSSAKFHLTAFVMSIKMLLKVFSPLINARK